MWRRFITVLLLLAIIGSLSACNVWNPRRPDTRYERFYQGTEGVRMRFVPGTPPARFFYHAGDPDNSFDISIELHNVGSSDAIGAVYVSGFSPDIVRLEGTNIDPRGVSDCVFDFNLFDLSSGTSDIGFYFSCMGAEVSHSASGSWNARLDGILDTIGGWFGIDNVPVSVSGNYHGENNWGLHIGWDAFGGLDVLNHGRALIIALSAIDFQRYNGYLFNKDKGGILRGDNYDFPGGEMGFVNIKGEIADNWPPGLDETDVTFLVTSCYGYATYAAPKICIDPAPFDETEKVCYPHEYTWSGSQGAPVAITSLKQDPTDRSTYLTFTIRNVGGGTVFNPGYLERCSPYFPGRLDSRHKDVVYIGDIRIGHTRLQCSPSYAVRLYNGEGTFTCEYRYEWGTAKSAYETPVVVELWYGYQETMRTTMHIKRVS